MSRTLQLFLLEIALLGVAWSVGILLVAVGWLLGWIGWLFWRLFAVAWAGSPKESYDVDEWPGTAAAINTGAEPQQPGERIGDESGPS